MRRLAAGSSKHAALALTAGDSMLTGATDKLISTLHDEASTHDDIELAIELFFDAASQATPDSGNEALGMLSAHLNDIEDASRASTLALICGALVERGCDPMALADPLVQQLKSLLALSAEFAVACWERVPQSKDERHDPFEEFERMRGELATVMPQHQAAWDALQRVWPLAIAVFSVSAEARSRASGLREAAAKISDTHEAGHWLRFMLSVLDNEPIMIIEPARSRGVLGHFSGVVDNFQLNVLLMDAFPRSNLFSRRRVSRQAAEVARGNGPQQTNEVITAAWNLYTWQAIEPGGVLPDPKEWNSDEHWIWNEGVPADIPIFDGYRVVLLGPASYPRTWQCQRIFSRLQARLDCEQPLSANEVQQWLARMVEAKRHANSPN
jgi:hypothetical protein